jgi:glycine betaine/proline transport system permease protein
VSTLSLVFVSTFVAVLLGIPLGVLAALSTIGGRIIMPILDVMQTMPAFVYLIPAIPFFGMGKVAAIFSTVIFAMPPAIKLTALGIKQTPLELVECANAFGSGKWQTLFKLQLPLAKPTIMAGVNQTVMPALSMVVIAAMIGAKGLGGEVWKAIQRLEMGRGFEAGIAIVIVAILFDRILQKVGRN